MSKQQALLDLPDLEFLVLRLKFLKKNVLFEIVFNRTGNEERLRSHKFAFCII